VESQKKLFREMQKRRNASKKLNEDIQSEWANRKAGDFLSTETNERIWSPAHNVTRARQLDFDQPASNTSSGSYDDSTTKLKLQKTCVSSKLQTRKKRGRKGNGRTDNPAMLKSSKSSSLLSSSRFGARAHIDESEHWRSSNQRGSKSTTLLSETAKEAKGLGASGTGAMLLDRLLHITNNIQAAVQDAVELGQDAPLQQTLENQRIDLVPQQQQQQQQQQRRRRQEGKGEVLGFDAQMSLSQSVSGDRDRGTFDGEHNDDGFQDLSVSGGVWSCYIPREKHGQTCTSKAILAPA
jgi:hypothetical protein